MQKQYYVIHYNPKSSLVIAIMQLARINAEGLEGTYIVRAYFVLAADWH
jgi:hypothetical protein